MTTTDTRRWAAPTTITGLGELTALWLEGALPDTPGYCGPPDEETWPIAPTLARLNRSGGIVTYGSQPGYDGTGHDDGARWIQRAAVQLLADPAAVGPLWLGAHAAGFIGTLHRSPLFRDRHDGVFGVTGRRDPDTGKWEDTCRFGAALSRRTLRLEFTGCNRRALRAVYHASQATLAAPVSGEDDRLWRWLDDWLDQREAS